VISNSRQVYPATRAFFSFPNLGSPLPFGNGDGGQPNVFHDRKILPYSQRQLYGVVSDVDSYGHFLPFCKRSRVLTPRVYNHPTNKDAYTVDAELAIGFGPVEESYISKVTCVPFESVEAVSQSRLFKNLTMVWSFQYASRTSPHPSNQPVPAASPSLGSATNTPDDGPTLLNVDLSYSFSNALHATLAGKVFDGVSKEIVEAFERRCLEVYGKGRK